MALQKQNLSINFAKGVDLDSDPFQIALDNFSVLDNGVINKFGRIDKRNGYELLTALPTGDYYYLTTVSGGLAAIGSNLIIYNDSSKTWSNKGPLQSLELNVFSTVKTGTAQSYADLSATINGFACVVYIDEIPVGGSLVPTIKYVIIDSVTGRNVIAPTLLIAPGGVATFAPKVFALGGYFIIVFNNVIAATNHLQYVAISALNPTVVTTAVDLSSSYAAASTGTFDGVVTNNRLYVAWNGSDGGGAIRVTSLSVSLGQSNTIVVATYAASHISVCSDTSLAFPMVHISFYNSATSTGFIFSVDEALVIVQGPNQIISTGSYKNITSSAIAQLVTIFLELAGTGSNSLIQKITCTITAPGGSLIGTIGSLVTVIRSVGLASKSFVYNNIIYFLAIHSSPNQPTYFLFDLNGNVIAKVAYSNADGLLVRGLPNAQLNGANVSIPYLIRNLIVPVNKTQGLSSSGVYTQTGVNVVNFLFNRDKLFTADVSNNLHISGGIFWMYDGAFPVEHGFLLWPEGMTGVASASGGSMTNQDYFYVVVYQWGDNQGNIHRSAPSIPVPFSVSNNGKVTLTIPTLRITYKQENSVFMVIYRWSTGQPIYYQITNPLNPILNSVLVNSVTYVDTAADTSIAGNAILYTSGGVIENIAAPPVTKMALLKSRLFVVDAENRNLIWFSKQVIQNVPVEFSDLFTIYVSPTTAFEQSAGGITALSAMDDKLIIFKRDSILYIGGGQGPDNTGTNNDFGEPILITSTVGSTNQPSIVFIPQGLMFQSDKGLWLLGRDLSTSYIGEPVDSFKDGIVVSAITVPGTSQVRFNYQNGITLTYDYIYNIWGAFTGIPAVYSTQYSGKHTFINSLGRVYREKEGSYTDGGKPVLIKVVTAWIKVSGLQGLQRVYEMFLLAVFKSPHNLRIGIAYDYNESIVQSTIISPDNYSGPYGGDNLWGGSDLSGGPSNIEQWRVFLERQKCEAIQITIEETYDPSFGEPAGAGLTISGLNFTVGIKDTKPKLPAKRSAG